MKRQIKITLKKILSYCYDNSHISKFIFTSNLLISNSRRNEILILATITKTGTHYIRFLIAYYLVLIELKAKNESFDSMRLHDDLIVDYFFPNSWHTSYRFRTTKKKPTALLSLLGLNDFPRSHMKFRSSEWKGCKVLHTYRSILDQSVVSWETKYNCDTSNNIFDNPKDVFFYALEDNSQQFLSFKDITPKKTNHLRISFNQIYNYPAESLSLIIMWLGFEPNQELCRISANLSKLTPSLIVGGGEKWHRFPHEYIDTNKLNTFFKDYSKTGAINIYKDYFNSSDLELMNQALSKLGLNKEAV